MKHNIPQLQEFSIKLEEEVKYKAFSPLSDFEYKLTWLKNIHPNTDDGTLLGAIFDFKENSNFTLTLQSLVVNFYKEKNVLQKENRKMAQFLKAQGLYQECFKELT